MSLAVGKSANNFRPIYDKTECAIAPSKKNTREVNVLHVPMLATLRSCLCRLDLTKVTVTPSTWCYKFAWVVMA